MAGPVKTVFVTHAAEFGGAELSLLEIFERIDRARVSPTLASFSDGPFADAVKSLGFSVRIIRGADAFVKARRAELAAVSTSASSVLKAAAAVPATLELAKFVRSEKADVVYTNSSKAHILGGAAGRLAGARVVWHFRDIFPQPRLRKFFARASDVVADTVVCNSRATAAQFESHKDFRIIYNGLPAEKVKAGRSAKEVRTDLGLTPQSIVAGMAGRLDRWKGIDTFIDAAGDIAARLPEARFVVAGAPIYGDSAYLAEIESRARAANVFEKTFFTGFRADVYDVMNAMDVYAYPSVASESFGRGIVEAMMLGKAVVSSDAGGPSEIVKDGETGYLFPVGDSRRLAELMFELLSDPQKASAMGAAGRARALELFNADRAIEEIVGLIEER